MGFLSKLFEKGEDPLPIVNDPQLGHLEWAEADEAWVGSYNGFHFSLSYDRKAVPTPEVSAYAKSMLGDAVWLMDTFEKEKDHCMTKAPSHLIREIAGLKLGRLYFSMNKGCGYVIANVEGGGDDRSWRIEFHDRKCDGMGFDT